VAVFLIAGATRADYNPWQTTISTLSLGEHGWIQIAGFSLFGLLTLCFAIGLRRILRIGPGSLLGPILLFIVGIGLVTAGPFVTDPILGYPPGSPLRVEPASLHGTIHNSASLIVFIALPVACFVMARRFAHDPKSRGWALYSITTGVLILVLVAWFFTSVTAAMHTPKNPRSIAGLLERTFSIIGCCWLSLLAFRFLIGKRK